MPGHPAGDYRRLRRSLVLRMALVSVIPLLVVSAANSWLFFRLNRAIVVDQHALSLRHQREALEQFLAAREAELRAITERYTVAELRGGELDRVFRVIRQQPEVLSDIGVIDSRGDHVQYVGPFDLAGRNYRDAPWFAEVVERGVYVSDVFLGYRGVPHFVIAVLRREAGDFWILRATVSADYFERLVNVSRSGRTGETFIVNEAGLYQTKGAHGRLLEPAGLGKPAWHEGTRVGEEEIGGTRYLVTTTWLGHPRWLLVYRQELGDVFAPLFDASLLGIGIWLLGAVGAVVLALAVARRQVRRIRQADQEKDAMAQRLVATGRVAAVGEMSAGLAHEINNPLATIDTLRTWIQDLGGARSIPEEDRQEILESAGKIGEQVARCKVITQGLLKFSRRVDAQPERIDVEAFLGELCAVARARARVDGVALDTEFDKLPPFECTPAHLQQIVMNVVNNALDATAGRPGARVVVSSRLEGGRVVLRVRDNGPGIPRENLTRIFQPFFTTKPVGRGTGLGLAICYGLVQELGGTIAVDSAAGGGTTFTIALPQRAPDAGRSTP
ncbi:MAG: sensor histidine kinase [Deltaproteobacteria bacterium]|nr:sensor histidine kinase [Deltaproteobacteria bacterium]